MKTHSPTAQDQDNTAYPTATPLPVPAAPFEMPASSLPIGDVVSSASPDPGTGEGGAVGLMPRPPSSFVGAGVSSAAVSMLTGVGAMVSAAVGAMVGAGTEKNTVAASTVHEV